MPYGGAAAGASGVYEHVLAPVAQRQSHRGCEQKGQSHGPEEHDGVARREGERGAAVGEETGRRSERLEAPRALQRVERHAKRSVEGEGCAVAKQVRRRVPLEALGGGQVG